MCFHVLQPLCGLRRCERSRSEGERFYERRAQSCELDRDQTAALGADHMCAAARELRDDLCGGIYKRIVIENNKVRGAVLYGDTRDGAWYCELMHEGRDVGALRDKLIFGAAVADKQ